MALQSANGSIGHRKSATALLTDSFPNFQTSETGGLLQKWLLLVTFFSVFNTAQCFLGGTTLTALIYGHGNQVTPLTARLFGTWTLLSAIIRFRCARDMHNKSNYDLTIITFVLALAHFLSECIIFESTSIYSAGLISPFVVATMSITWMVWCRSFYCIKDSGKRND